MCFYLHGSTHNGKSWEKNVFPMAHDQIGSCRPFRQLIKISKNRTRPPKIPTRTKVRFMYSNSTAYDWMTKWAKRKCFTCENMLAISIHFFYSIFRCIIGHSKNVIRGKSRVDGGRTTNEIKIFLANVCTFSFRHREILYEKFENHSIQFECSSPSHIWWAKRWERITTIRSFSRVGTQPRKYLYQFCMDMIWHVSREKWVIKPFYDFHSHANRIRSRVNFHGPAVSHTARTRHPTSHDLHRDESSFRRLHISEGASVVIAYGRRYMENTMCKQITSLVSRRPNESWRIRFCLTLPMNCILCAFGPWGTSQSICSVSKFFLQSRLLLLVPSRILECSLMCAGHCVRHIEMMQIEMFYSKNMNSNKLCDAMPWLYSIEWIDFATIHS